MGFQSILGVNKMEAIRPEDIDMPMFFYDLNLDLIVQDIMEEQKLYDLRRYYYYKGDEKDIAYRLEVMKDLQQGSVLQSIVVFSISLRKAKEYFNNIAETDNIIQKQKWKLDSAGIYIEGVMELQKNMELYRYAFNSQGLTSFRDWLDTYIISEEFSRLKYDTEQIMKQFNEMRFHIRIKRDRVIINQGYLEEDYCKQLQDTFKEQSTEKHFYQQNPFGSIILSGLEEAVLDILKKPYAQTFQELKVYDSKYSKFFNPTLSEFDQESQFYIAFCLYRDKMKDMNFHFCFPEISEKEELRITDGYDLALAKKNAMLKKEVVYNDCYFEPKEQFFVITGPNQGGKTTFARALGQILYFQSVGLMVPCREAHLPNFDGIYTHFASEEAMDTGAGKLKEELIRLKAMMRVATKRSFIIINEIFTSATTYDAHIMGKRVIDYFMDQGCHGIYVTHIYELTKDDDRVVSLVASLLSQDSHIRTFKMERRPADGRSYANTIVEKHRMTYLEIKERIL